MKRFPAVIATLLGLVAGCVNLGGCAVLRARVDVYDQTEDGCGLESRGLPNTELVSAAKTEHNAKNYDAAPDLKEARDTAFEVAARDAEEGLRILKKLNKTDDKWRLVSLLDDPRVAQVVHADKKCWERRSPVNDARAVSRGGNADIAIKMEKDGKFVVKGVRLDAEKVTEAIFKSVNKAIVLVAQAYGVPAGGNGGGPSNGDGTAAALTAERLDGDLTVRRRAAFELLESLATEAPAVQNADTNAEATQRIKAALAGRRALLQPSSQSED